MRTLLLLLFLAATSYAAPLVITHGGSYTGSYYSDDPAIPAVIVQTGEQVEISATIESYGDGISVSVPMSNLIVHDCHFISKGNGFGIVAPNIQGIQVLHNYFQGWRCAAVLANPPGSPFTGPSFAIDDNQIRDSKGGAILINGLVGVIFGDISWNEVINHPRKEGTADQISIYQSTGLSAQSISVHDNYVEGIFPSLYASVWNATGILTDGDLEAGGVSWNVLVSGNTVVNVGGGGIGLAFGHYCTAENNRVVSASIDWRTGLRYPLYCLGMAVYQGDQTNVIQNNVIGVNGGTYYQAGARADAGFPGASWGTYLGNSSLHDGEITKSDEDQELAYWHHKVWYYGQQIGPR